MAQLLRKDLADALHVLPLGAGLPQDLHVAATPRKCIDVLLQDVVRGAPGHHHPYAPQRHPLRVGCVDVILKPCFRRSPQSDAANPLRLWSASRSREERTRRRSSRCLGRGTQQTKHKRHTSTPYKGPTAVTASTPRGAQPCDFKSSTSMWTSRKQALCRPAKKKTLQWLGVSAEGLTCSFPPKSGPEDQTTGGSTAIKSPQSRAMLATARGHVLLQSSGALLQHLRGIRVTGHGRKDGPNASTGATGFQSHLVLGQSEQRPDRSLLQLL